MPDTAEIAAISQVTEVENTVSAIAAVSQVTEVENSVSAIAAISQVTEVENSVSAIASMSLVIEVTPQGAQAIISDVNGTINTPVTFDGSASIGDSFSWAWTSVPAGSAFATPGPVLYPDDGATTPIDMTDNEGLYHFDGNADDSSGNNRNGNVVGATQVAGFIGTNAYQFNGTASQYITLGGTTDYHFTTEPFTIAGWFKPDNTQTNNWANIFSTLGGGGYWGSHIRGYVLGQIDNNNNLYRVLARTGTSWVESSSFTLPGGVWTHFVLVRNGSNWKVYLNGSQQLSETLTANINQTGNNSALILGKTGLDYAPIEAWKGAIDEFAIWSRALSASEVADIYAKQSQVAGFVDLGQTSSGTATLYPDNGASTPIDMANNRALLHFNGNTTDTSGNGITVTTNDTSFATGFDGTTNGSLALNSDTSRALLSPAPSLSGGNWTVALWFYNLKPNSDWRTGVRGSNRDHQIIVENGGDRLGVWANGNGDFRPSGFNMPSGDYQGWHHIVAVGSGSTTTFYVNGVNVGSSDRKSTDNIYAVGNGSWSGAHQIFSDRIDEFAVWSRALSATEIANIYSLQSAGRVSITSSATFTPDVIGTYQAQFTAFRGAFADTVTVAANITESSAGLPSRSLAGGLVGATTLSYASVRPGSLLPFGMAAAITSTASSPAEEASSPAEETSSPAEEASSPAEEEEDDMKLIFNTTLTSDSSTISTGTLDTGYRDLLITASLKSDRSAAMDTGLIEFNNDGTDSNYAHIRMAAEGNPAANVALSNTSGILRLLGNVMGTTSDTANHHTALTVRIPRHENTTVYKNWQVIDGSNNPPTNISPITNQTTGTWKNTAAITSITLRLEYGGFVAGSSIDVYGLK